jgi:hypothetical protein
MHAFAKTVPKFLVYDALAALNRDFEQVLRDLERLDELRLFRHRWQRDALKLWRATLEETQAWVSFEVVEILHEKEEREWVRLSRIRQQLEKPTALRPIKSNVSKSQPPSSTVPP